MKLLSWSWWVGETQARRTTAEATYERRVASESLQHTAVLAANAARAERRRLESAAMSALRCPKCAGSLMYSSENDYVCDVHGFVNPVDPDGNIISGDGYAGPRRVIGHVSDAHPMAFAYHAWLVKR